MARIEVSLTSVQAAIARAIRLDASAFKRIEKAATLIVMGHVQKVTDSEYTVMSQTVGHTRYTVTPGGCECIDAERHPGQRCKHQWAVRILLSAEQAEAKAREEAAPKLAAQIGEVVAEAFAALTAQYPTLTLAEVERLAAFKRRYNAEATVPAF